MEQWQCSEMLVPNSVKWSQWEASHGQYVLEYHGIWYNMGEMLHNTEWVWEDLTPGHMSSWSVELSTRLSVIIVTLLLNTIIRINILKMKTKEWGSLTNLWYAWWWWWLFDRSERQTLDACVWCGGGYEIFLVNIISWERRDTKHQLSPVFVDILWS